MIVHIVLCTLVAMVAALAAIALRKRKAASIRHAILLVAMIGFAIPTPWLIGGGALLVPYVGPSGSGTLSTVDAFLRTAGAIGGNPGVDGGPVANVSIWIVLWMIGAAVSLAISFRGIRWNVASVRAATPVETQALEVARTALGLRAEVALRIVSSDRVPGAHGLIRSEVLLPDGLSLPLSDAELATILAHELAHIQRKDNLTSAVARIIRSLFWFHPLLWWMERSLLIERELACDELVLAKGALRQDYISGILKVCYSVTGVPLAVERGYAGINGSNLKSRMENIMTAGTTQTSKLFRALPVGFAVLAIAIPIGVGCAQRRPIQAQTPVSNGAADALIESATASFRSGGKFDEAEAKFRKARELDPESFQALVGLVETLMQQKKSDEAIRTLEGEVARNPGRSDVRIALGNVFVRTENFKRAIAEYQEVRPQTGDVLFKTAEAYRRFGDLKHAAEKFGEAADANPPHPAAKMQMALLADGTGKTQEAAALYEDVLKLEPENYIALNNLAYLRAKRREYDGALALARHAFQLRPNEASICDTLAWVYFERGETAAAIPLFRDAVLLAPANMTVRRHLVAALDRRGERSPYAQKLRVALLDEEETPQTLREFVSALKD